MDIRGIGLISVIGVSGLLSFFLSSEEISHYVEDPQPIITISSTQYSQLPEVELTVDSTRITPSISYQEKNTAHSIFVYYIFVFYVFFISIDILIEYTLRLISPRREPTPKEEQPRAVTPKVEDVLPNSSWEPPREDKLSSIVKAEHLTTEEVLQPSTEHLLESKPQLTMSTPSAQQQSSILHEEDQTVNDFGQEVQASPVKEEQAEEASGLQEQPDQNVLEELQQRQISETSTTLVEDPTPNLDSDSITEEPLNQHQESPQNIVRRAFRVKPPSDAKIDAKFQAKLSLFESENSNDAQYRPREKEIAELQSRQVVQKQKDNLLNKLKEDLHKPKQVDTPPVLKLRLKTPSAADNVASTPVATVEKEEEVTTQSLEPELKTGDVTDPDTMLHVLHNIVGQMGLQFFTAKSLGSTDFKKQRYQDGIDSSVNEGYLSEASSHIFATPTSQDSAQVDLQFSLNQNYATIPEGSCARLDFEKKLIGDMAKIMDISPSRIQINSLAAGSIKVHATIHPATNPDQRSASVAAETLIDTICNSDSDRGVLNKIVAESLRVELKPLYDKYVFDLDALDPKWDYDFTHDKPRNEKRGGVPYYRPCGWNRFALKVAGKYENDKWLGSSNREGEWPVTFHGTFFERANSTLKPFKGIIEGGLQVQGGETRAPNGAVYGVGVYTCPKVDSWPKRYAEPWTFNTPNGKKRYQLVFQCRVRPNSYKMYANDEVWVVPNAQDVRPYGILLKICEDNES